MTPTTCPWSTRAQKYRVLVVAIRRVFILPGLSQTSTALLFTGSSPGPWPGPSAQSTPPGVPDRVPPPHPSQIQSALQA